MRLRIRDEPFYIKMTELRFFLVCKESVLQVCKRGHRPALLRESHDLPVTITFASTQVVDQTVEETDTSKIITKISCDRVDYE